MGKKERSASVTEKLLEPSMIIVQYGGTSTASQGMPFNRYRDYNLRLISSAESGSIGNWT